MRKFFATIHLWLSIPFGVIIAVVCLTGAVLVFEKELLEVCYPSRYFVREVKGEVLPPADLMREARRQLPDSVQLNGLRVFPDPERTWQVVLPGKKATAFIDPYTGEIMGVDDGQGFFMQMMRLHRWLLDEYKRDGGFSWGKSLVGYASLVLAVILVSGIVIWVPRNWKVLKVRLRIRTKAGWFRFFYDLHVSGGFYTALLLLVLTLTGLTWSFGWYKDAFYTVFGVETTEIQAHAPAPAAPRKDSEEKGRGGKDGGDRSERGKPSQSEKGKGIGRGDRGDKGERVQKGTDYTQWAEVLSGLQRRYADYNSITVQDGSATVSTARYGNTMGSDRYSFDPATGYITDVQLYKDLPSSGKIRGWIYSVHVGTWGGMATRILSCLVSFLGGVFAITGYYSWIRKKVRKRG